MNPQEPNQEVAREHCILKLCDVCLKNKCACPLIHKPTFKSQNKIEYLEVIRHDKATCTFNKHMYIPHYCICGSEKCVKMVPIFVELKNKNLFPKELHEAMMQMFKPYILGGWLLCVCLHFLCILTSNITRGHAFNISAH